MASERRTVTVLFADVSGFTRLSESMDPEDVQDLMDGLFRRLREAIEQQGGTIDKFIGDAVMAVFGAPVAHADDASRAIRAAIEMQKRTAAFGAERGVELKMRIGLNSGEVLWGTVGGDRATATGDTVNVAQRLESSATPGCILVSAAIQEATLRQFMFRALGPVQLKGRGDAVESFEVVEELGAGTERRLVGAVTAACIGRDTDLAKLQSFALSGRAFAVLEGEAGIGKSRLLAELRRRLRSGSAGIEIHVGRSLEGARLPLAPFAEILRTASGVRWEAPDAGQQLAAWLRISLETLEEHAIARENYAHLIVHSVGLRPSDTRVRFVEPARLAAETRHAWGRWLKARGDARPLLLCVEDMHWADEGTIALLDALRADETLSRVVILATTRPGGPALPGWTRVAVEDLDEPSSARLAAEVLQKPVDPALAAFLFSQTGGHPLFIEELVHHLREAGLIAGSPAALTGSADRLPKGLHGILVARLDALPVAQKEALKAASVMGRVFWLGILESLVGVDAVSALAGAVDKRLVTALPGSLVPGDREYLFRHALIREAAYALLPKRDRARLHALAAAEFEKRIASGGRRLRALAAVQRELAGETMEAARLWILAATEAQEEYAWEEAVAAGREAKRLAGTVEASLVLAEALQVSGELESAEREARDAESHATNAEDRVRARAVIADACLHQGNCQGVLALPECLGEEGAPLELRIRVEATRARALSIMGRFEEAEARVDRLLPMTEGPALVRQKMFLLSTRCHALWTLGNAEPALQFGMQALELARGLGDRRMQAGLLGNVGLMHWRFGDLAQARTIFEEANREQIAIGDRWGQAGTRANLGLVLVEFGLHQEALEHHKISLELHLRTRNMMGVAGATHQLANLQLDLGDTLEAIRLYRDVIRQRTESGDAPGLVPSMMGLARALRDVGPISEARDVAREALRVARNVKSARLIGLSQVILASIDGVDGRTAEAEAGFAEAFHHVLEGVDREIALFERLRFRLATGTPGAIDDAEDLARTTRSPYYQRCVRFSLARAKAAAGRIQDALDEMAAACRANPAPTGKMALMMELEDEAYIRRLAGDLPAARRLVERGTEIALASGCLLHAARFRKLGESLSPR